MRAGTNGFVVPTFRASVDSQAGYWETFITPVGQPGNAPDKPGSTTGAVLTQSDTNAFLTGSGNIYNLGTSSFTLTDTTPYPLVTVVLQTRTVGSELDYSSISLVYTNSNGIQTVRPAFRYELNRAAAQGFSVSSLWQWDLTGLGVTAYAITFQAGGTSVSFDSLTLDTAAQFTPAFPEQPFTVASNVADISRWMYSFNGNPASRPTASVFGALGSNPDFDSRDAQYLLGWTTTNRVLAGQGARNYLIKRARVTLTIASGNQYVYNETLPDYRSHFPTNDPRYVAPVSTGAPVELFGAGFRGGFTAATYSQDGPWAVDENAGYYTNRVAYAAGFDTNGVLVDVSNNVADNGTNEIEGAFEVAPFAVGRTTSVAPGQTMPVGGQLTFDLNLDDPLIYGYLQNALNDGRLRLMVSSYVGASFSGPPTYPNFYTSFSPLATPSQYPLLDVEGEILRSNVDGDGDGLADDWENFYFGSLTPGAQGDTDLDGATNLVEYQAGTDPISTNSLLRFLSLQSQGTTAELHFTYAPGHTYSIQTTSDLKVWEPVTNPVLSYSSAWLSKSSANLVYPTPVYSVWRDTNAAALRRFYRVSAE